MRVIVPFVIVVSMACAPVTTAADSYVGEWKQVDIRTLEKAPPACMRLWFEERSYKLQQTDTLRGLYGNVIRSAPLGAPSLQPDCKYWTVAPRAAAMQFRIWQIVARPTDDGGYRVGAQPMKGGGDFNSFKTEEFNTVIALKDGSLVDGVGGDALVFHRPAQPSADARMTLEQTITRLETGGCLEVMASMGSRLIAPQVCDLRRRIGELAGRYIGLSVISSMEFDRVPDNFPNESKSLKRQHGVHFSFNGQYENQKIPGDALVFEENGKWRVAFLWF